MAEVLNFIANCTCYLWRSVQNKITLVVSHKGEADCLTEVTNFTCFNALFVRARADK